MRLINQSHAIALILLIEFRGHASTHEIPPKAHIDLIIRTNPIVLRSAKGITMNQRE